ncbi:hypothetical protein BGZ63DRAFT_202307 [Mariannaea sp. PMI_226]|nr:hypothetical protein BGZ63DRAFT_202307 [Mariannaea sp. PMI_226]
MVFSLRLVALLATARLVGAQVSLGTYPTCAGSCSTIYTGESSGSQCNSFDYECICTNKAFLDNAVCCLLQHCSDDDIKSASDYTRNFCSIEGYTLPSGIACASGSSSSSQAAASSSSAASGSFNTAGSDSATSTAVGDSSTFPTSNTSNGDDNNDDNSSSDNSFNSHKSTHKTSSKTLKTALGVGLGVGIPLIIAIAGFFLRKKRKTANPESTAVSQMPPAGPSLVSHPPPPPPGPPSQAYSTPSNGPPGYPPQQGYSPQPYQFQDPNTPSPVGVYVDPQKMAAYGVSPAYNVNTIPNPHEMMDTTPPPVRHELAPDSRPHTELPTNIPPTHQELP